MVYVEYIENTDKYSGGYRSIPIGVESRAYL